MRQIAGPRAALSLKMLVVSTLAAFIGLAGCPAAETVTGEVRAIHLSPDAPAVDVWQRDPTLRIVSDIEFTESSAYTEIDEGTYTLEIVPAGEAIGDSVLTVEDVTIEEDGNYTAAVIGTLDELTAILLRDDLSTPPQNQFRLRIVHAAPGVGEVDIWNITDPEAPAPLVENVEFGEFSDHLEIPAGAYVVGLDATGDELPDIVFELPTLTAGTILNLFAVQDEEGEPFLLAQFDDGTTARIDPRPETPELGENEAGVRLVHLSPDAPAVDIWGPEEPLVTGLAFAEGTDFIVVPADVALVEVVPAGEDRDEAVLTVEEPPLQAGQFYTVVVFGEIAEDELSVLLLQDDLSPTIPGAIRIRPVHTASGVGPVDIWAARDGQPPIPAFEDLDFGQAAEYLEIPAGAYSIGLDVGRDGLIDATVDLGAVTAATVANVFAALDMEGLFFLVQENGRYTRVDATFEDEPGLPEDVLPLRQ